MFSVPFVSPSLSQSAAAHTAFEVVGVAPTACAHGSSGFVPLVTSCPFVVPSPSQSALFHAVLGVST